MQRSTGNFEKDAANFNSGQTKKISSNKFDEYSKATNNQVDIFSARCRSHIFQERFLNSEIQVMFLELDTEIPRDEILK